ncbi:hypothetical protein LTR62_007656 [Meristemomyces frigidus]|uniref:Homeobox domain-containing protein n=1 Tax=Meristemomyces frigidus TaxID=1508187 RepID=A0AAN7TEB2_9PEZI|nr:hypothetical protein LTR62_007656 [Meristemomyces frigidus]
MIDERLQVPLSPPTSPRMSDAFNKPTEYQWRQSSPLSGLHPITTSYQPLLPPTPAVELARDAQHLINTLSRPQLRTHKSFPYSLGPSSRLSAENAAQSNDGPALADFKEILTSQGPQPVGNSDLRPATFGGSAPTSPVGRLTPNSPAGGSGDDQMDDEEMGFSTAEQGDDGDRAPMTAAELRAHKRKMKRFRLTHNQTRFLMAEFARQPHPDAAHRERLSREIPGLSPRQVQVWFQNRRAKLKRLTTDDRERMLRSRALPANFDMTTALHSPFKTQAPQTGGTPMPSPSNFAALGESTGLRPLTLDTIRREPEYESFAQPQYTTPTGATPALSVFGFTPPQSATSALSPTSMATGAQPFGYHTQESPRRPTYGLHMSNQTGFVSQHPQLQRHQLHDRFAKPYSESASSPLRTSMSYSGLPTSSHNHALNQPPERSSSYSEHSAPTERPSISRRMTGPGQSGMAEGVGLGFSYTNMPSYSSSDQQQHSMPVTTTHQPSADLGYRRSSSHLAGPPLNAYPSYHQSSHFGSTHSAHYSSLNGHFTQPYSSSMQTSPHQSAYQQESGLQGYTSIPSQPQQYITIDDQDGEDGENSDGGVPLPSTY